MPTKLSRILTISLLALSVSGSVAFAWTAPTLPPPNGNIDEPINAGSLPQTKAGGFGALWAAFVDLLITGSIQGTDAVTGLATDLALNPDGGNVGIGTTNPGAKLDVNGTIRSRTGSFQLHDGTTNGGGLLLHKTIAGSGTSYDPAIFAEGVDGRLHFMTGGSATTKMLIDKDGNVGIGTGTATPGEKLEVSGNIKLNSGNNLHLNGGTTYGLKSNDSYFDTLNTGVTGDALEINYRTAGPVKICATAACATTSATFNTDSSTTFAGAISGTNATFTGSVTADSFLYFSDLNLKKNIASLSGQLGKILQLRGVSFDWKKDGKHSTGLIAQEVEKVYPELVSTDKVSGLKSVEYGNLVAPLIEAVKEQQKQIDALKAEIENLKK